MPTMRSRLTGATYALARLQGGGRLVLILALAFGFMVVQAPRAHAYSGGNAAAYADRYAVNGNCGNYPCLSDDCTNFVSQAVHAGGFSMKGIGGSTTDDNNWFIQSCWWCWYGYNWSHSWTVAGDYYTFLQWDYPGGYNWGTKSGSDAEFYSGLDTGDVLFYDWDSNGSLDHSAIQVSVGTDPTSGWYGDLIDEHTSNRYHAFWSLDPYNSRASTTTITLEHISSSNT